MIDQSKYPTRIAPYGLRMPDDLKARVQAAAEAKNRSMNAEIVAVLDEKYPRPIGIERDHDRIILAVAAIAKDVDPSEYPLWTELLDRWLREGDYHFVD